MISKNLKEPVFWIAVQVLLNALFVTWISLNHFSDSYENGSKLVFTHNVWLGHYGTNRKVAGSRPDEMNFYIYLILPATLGPGVQSASNRNEYQKQKNNNFSGE
jgi:hypothetical protein